VLIAACDSVPARGRHHLSVPLPLPAIGELLRAAGGRRARHARRRGADRRAPRAERAAFRSRYVAASGDRLAEGLGPRCVFLADGRHASCTIYPRARSAARTWPCLGRAPRPRRARRRRARLSGHHGRTAESRIPRSREPLGRSRVVGAVGLDVDESRAAHLVLELRKLVIACRIWTAADLAHSPHRGREPKRRARDALPTTRGSRRWSSAPPPTIAE
jgi:hypothetical protein